MKAKVKLNEYTHKAIKISGSKNSSLPIIAASILCDEEVTIYNVPNIVDINKLVSIIKKMGYTIIFHNNTITVKETTIKQKKFHFKEIKQLRGSYYLIGALIGKYHYSNFSFLYPGGCKFGNRPIDFHLKAFKTMNINVYTKKNKLFFKGYKNSIIHNLEYPSVGATINIILANCKSTKETIITNAAIEPEVIDLCNFINSMGAEILIKNRSIIIKGNEYFKKTKYTVMGDRIEAGTFLILGAIHKGITITNIEYNHISDIISLLKTVGYNFIINKNNITLFRSNNTIFPFDITLSPYPGFPTDLGPLLCVLASQIKGQSSIKDLVYVERTSHINELKKMNIDICLDNGVIKINGKNNIINNKVKSYDLRCSAALVLAASLSKSFSYIYDIDKLFRGYEQIQNKLNYLGIEFIY